MLWKTDKELLYIEQTKSLYSSVHLVHTVLFHLLVLP